MQIGGTMSGRGVAAALSIWKYLPLNVGCSSVHISRQICTTSSSWRSRTAVEGKS